MDSDNPSGADNQQETLKPRDKLEPAWIAGFVDGEGCFNVSVHRNSFMHRHRGWQLQPAFQVYQHQDHRWVLEALRAHFKCGYVRAKGPKSSVLAYSVTALRDLTAVTVPFFEQNRLLVKSEDFTAFASVVGAMQRKEHLTEVGFERIVRLAYGMNANGKQRSRSLGEVLEGSSETTRQARFIESISRSDIAVKI